LAGITVDVIENLEQGGFCGMEFAVGRLEYVEVVRFVDLRQEPGEEESLKDFGQSVEVGDWTVVGRVVGV
jgi:hypothetical protein